MNGALQGCGFNPQTIQYLVNQGFANPADLLLASETDLDSMARNLGRNPPRGLGGNQVTMPFIALKNLKGFRFWADERKRTGLDTNPDNFTAASVISSAIKCQEYKELKEASRDEDVSKPDHLKKLAKWALWNEAFHNYFRQIVCAAKIPLIYLTRDEREADVALNPDDYPSPTAYLIDATILEGRHFALDNPRFYRELKSFTVNGEGWSYIKKFERSQDGRRAYLALKTQCEGTASKITRKNRAYASIANAVYSGSRRQYKFQDYINTHQSAHNEILDCDPTEAVPESKKVADFLKGITDPKLESAVSVILGDTRMLNNFQMCQQYLSTTVENRATLEKSKDRNISGVKSTSDKSGGGKKGTGKLPKNFKLKNKYYPPRIYRLLSQEQKDQPRNRAKRRGKGRWRLLRNRSKN